MSLPDVGPTTETFCAPTMHEWKRHDVSDSVFTVFCQKCPFSVTMTTKLDEFEMAAATRWAKNAMDPEPT